MAMLPPAGLLAPSKPRGRGGAPVRFAGVVPFALRAKSARRAAKARRGGRVSAHTAPGKRRGAVPFPCWCRSRRLGARGPRAGATMPSGCGEGVAAPGPAPTLAVDCQREYLPPGVAPRPGIIAVSGRRRRLRLRRVLDGEGGKGERELAQGNGEDAVGRGVLAPGVAQPHVEALRQYPAAVERRQPGFSAISRRSASSVGAFSPRNST